MTSAWPGMGQSTEVPRRAHFDLAMRDQVLDVVAQVQQVDAVLDGFFPLCRTSFATSSTEPTIASTRA